jgi:ketosteroid isomerase-like protein
MLFFALLTPAPRANASSPVEAQVLKLEHEWLDAAARRDRGALDRILAQDFVDISYTGAVRLKSDVLAARAAPDGTKQALDTLKVRVYGQTAVVTGRNTVSAADGSRVAVLRFTDVFVRQDGAWRAVSAQETLER